MSIARSGGAFILWLTFGVLLVGVRKTLSHSFPPEEMIVSLSPWPGGRTSTGGRYFMELRWAQKPLRRLQSSNQHVLYDKRRCAGDEYVPPNLQPSAPADGTGVMLQLSWSVTCRMCMVMTHSRRKGRRGERQMPWVDPCQLYNRAHSSSRPLEALVT